MFRIITLPPRIGISSVSLVNGPASRGSGTNTAMDGTEQTFSTFGQLPAFQLNFSPRQAKAARRQRGFMAALQNGANALRFKLPDPDRLSVANSRGARTEPHGWANGVQWQGTNWAPSRPLVDVQRNASQGTDVVRLANRYWGRILEPGDWIGFGPLHFGAYMITETEGFGYYRIFPRLRKAITFNDFATLMPVVIGRPAPGFPIFQRGPGVTQGGTLTLVEVPDHDVREYFKETLR